MVLWGGCSSCPPKICLGEAARDEFHVVEIVPAEEGDARAPVPLATLKPSVLPMVSARGGGCCRWALLVGAATTLLPSRPPWWEWS